MQLEMNYDLAKLIQSFQCKRWNVKVKRRANQIKDIETNCSLTIAELFTIQNFCSADLMWWFVIFKVSLKKCVTFHITIKQWILGRIFKVHIFVCVLFNE